MADKHQMIAQLKAAAMSIAAAYGFNEARKQLEIASSELTDIQWKS